MIPDYQFEEQEEERTISSDMTQDYQSQEQEEEKNKNYEINSEKKDLELIKKRGEISALNVSFQLMKLNYKDKKTFNKWKLQKLLYFIQGYYLQINSKPLFYEDIECWQYGDFIPKIHIKTDGFYDYKKISENEEKETYTKIDKNEIYEKNENEKVKVEKKHQKIRIC